MDTDLTNLCLVTIPTFLQFLTINYQFKMVRHQVKIPSMQLQKFAETEADEKLRTVTSLPEW